MHIISEALGTFLCVNSTMIEFVATNVHSWGKKNTVNEKVKTSALTLIEN